MIAWDAVAPYVYVLAALALWWILVRELDRRKLLERYHMSAWGPVIMWRTQRGRELIDRTAQRKRAWRFYGNFSLILVGVTMVAMLILLFWEATLVQNAAVRANPPSPVEYLGLPGVNPLIPVGYGVFALVVAIVLHEFAHGILARVAGIKIQSLGIVLILLPFGAFVEPDEDEMRAMPRKERARLYAAGPATNLVLAVLFAFLFSTVILTSVAPIHDGVGIVGFTTGGSPTETAGVQPYTIITSLNGQPIHTYADFQAALAATRPNETVALQTYDGTSYAMHNVTLGTNPSTGGAFLGIYALDVSTDYYHPLTNPDRFGGVVNSLLLYVSLPFQGRAPIQDPELRFYKIEGPLAAVPSSMFWIVTNSFYWLFWLNFALGTTNALPAVPLDGGGLFKDAVEGFLVRWRRGMGKEQRDRVVAQVTAASSFLILVLILWQFVGPRI